MRHPPKKVSTIAALAALALTAAAQEPGELSLEQALTLPLEELMTVSIATGTPRTLAGAPAIATVITAADIRAMGATDLDQVLESVPGLHVSRTHMAYNPQYVMRGLHSETSPYVLFLTNGVPMTLWASGNVGEFWGGLPVAAISRIEVIRGPGSALFGADAVGGVVNIVTKTAAEIGGVEAGVRAGSFNTAEGWLLYGGEHGGIDVALGLQGWTTEGQREIVEIDAQTGFDRVFGTRASLAPGAVSTGGDGVEANLDLSRGDWRLRYGFQGRFDLGTGGGFIQILDPTGSTDRRRHTADLTWRRPELTERWGLELQASYLRDRGESDIVSAPPGHFNGRSLFRQGVRIAFGNTERQWRVGAAATYDGSERHRLRLGAGTVAVHFADVDSKRNTDIFGFPLPGGFQDVSGNPALIFGTAQRRDIRFAFIQDEWRLAEGWDLTVGVRWDGYSDFGDTVNPRLALVWKGSERLTAKLLYGRAFRPPSYREQYLINNPEILGNPALEPEVMSTVELGFSYRPSAHSRLGVNVFSYRLEEVILPAGPPPVVYRNVGERRGEGFEVEGEWKGGAFEVAGNYAVQSSTDETTGTDAGHAPGQQLYLRADWRFGRGFRLGAALNAVADRERVFGDPRPPIGDDATVDLVLRREKLGRFDFGVVVRNLFDEEVHEPSSFIPGPILRYVENDLPMAGRAAFVEVRFRM